MMTVQVQPKSRSNDLFWDNFIALKIDRTKIVVLLSEPEKLYPQGHHWYIS